MAAARKRVGGGEQDGRALVPVAAGQLADGRRLAGPVDAHDEDDRGQTRTGRSRSPFARLAGHEERGELGPHGRLGGRRVAAGPGPLHDLDRQGRADVAGDERLLDVVPRRPARPAAEEATQPTDEPGPTLLETGDEVARRSRRPDRAEGSAARRRRRRFGGGRQGGGSGSAGPASKSAGSGSQPGGASSGGRAASSAWAGSCASAVSSLGRRRQNMPVA